MTYEPDEQDELIGDAMAVGGPAFVEELHWAAMEAAEAVCPWAGQGPEPAAYRRAWLEEARRLVAARRAGLASPQTTRPQPDGTASPDPLPDEGAADAPGTGRACRSASGTPDPDGAP